MAVFEITATAQTMQLRQPSSVPYRWKSVQIVGGGFVDGIIFHPTAKGVSYCRTDMGVAYRRNDKTMRWEPLLDWLSYDELNPMGVESIAVDPSDANRVYLACGTYTNPRTPNGAILRSNDRGKTFQRTDMPFKMGGNENGRGNGERMAVDPNDGDIIYFGSRHNGLWRSNDQDESRQQISSFPDVTETPPDSIKDPNELRRWTWTNQGSGIIFVVFDLQGGSAGTASSTLFVGVSLMNRDNLFRSTELGAH